MVARILTATADTAYIYMLWSYYLGHVWGFLVVTNWATFVFFEKAVLSKTTIKIGVSADLFSKKKDAQFRMVTTGPRCRFLSCANVAQLVTIKVAQLVTIENPKRGPVNNFTAYIYIYISIHLSGVIIWVKFVFEHTFIVVSCDLWDICL